MMDVDDARSQSSMFDVINSFHRQKSSQSFLGTSSFKTSINLGAPSAPFRHLHEYSINELTDGIDGITDISNKEAEQSSNSRKAPRKQGRDSLCIQLPNTGRIVYAKSTNEVSDIYKALGKNISGGQPQRKRNDSEQDFDSDSLRKLNDLTLAAQEASNSASQMPGVSSSRSKLSQSTQNVSNTTSNKGNSSKGSGGVSATSKAPGSSAKPAVHAGRAAAMARMAAMGEEWPDEEELPGFSRPNTSSAINSSTGTLSRDANKQLNDAMQRQKKVVTSKKKG